MRRVARNRRIPSAGPFVPTVLGRCVLWLRADLGVTIATGVSSWADQSGAGLVTGVTQATGANQPTYSTGDSNFAGRPSLGFAGSQFLTSVTHTQAQPITTYAVASVTTEASAVFLISTAVSNRCDLYKDATGKFNIFAASSLPFGSASNNSPHAICGVFQNTTSSIYVDSSASPVNGTAGVSAWDMLQVGAIYGSSGITGSVTEVVAFNVAHTQSQVQQMFQYFGARYGKSWS